MEIPKLHPVTVLIRDHFPQQRDFSRRVQENSVRFSRGLLKHLGKLYRGELELKVTTPLPIL